MGQILYEPPDVAGWDLGPVVVLDRRDAGAHELRVDAGRQSEVQAGDVGQGRQRVEDAGSAAGVRARRAGSAPLDTSVTAELSNYLRATGAWTGSDAQLQAKAPGLVHLIAGSPEYQLV